MSSNRPPIRKVHLVLITVISALVITGSSINNHGYFDVTKAVYGQSVPDQMSSNTTNLVNLHDIPLEKVRVGDIDIAHKMFGKGEPIVLVNGASEDMNAWDPSFLKELASNHTVIVFDSRGIGNTTAGTAPYSIKLLANDMAGLMDALKIQKANVLGLSLGSLITQQFAISHPDKVNSVILVASSCGGKENIPSPPEKAKLDFDIANKTKNNVPISRDELKTYVIGSLGAGWIKLHPESVDLALPAANLTSFQQVRPGIPPTVVNNQVNAGSAWFAPNWNGACDDLAKIAKPTLVIAGTDDNFYVPHGNSLVIASKVPGAWLVQIKDAGHAVIDQFPNKVANIVNTFLSTTGQNR